MLRFTFLVIFLISLFNSFHPSIACRSHHREVQPEGKRLQLSSHCPVGISLYFMDHRSRNDRDRRGTSTR